MAFWEYVLGNLARLHLSQGQDIERGYIARGDTAGRFLSSQHPFWSPSKIIHVRRRTIVRRIFMVDETVLSQCSA